MLHPTIETLPLMPIPQHSWLIVNHPEKARIGTKISILTQLNANQVPTRVTIPHLLKGTSTIEDRLVSAVDDFSGKRFPSTLHCLSLTSNVKPHILNNCELPKKDRIDTKSPILTQLNANRVPIRVTIPHLLKGTSTIETDYSQQ